MTDAQIERVLAEGHPVAAVLLSRGHWLKAERVWLEQAFPADASSPAVWRIDLMAEDVSWHSVFCEAASIVGVSVHRSVSANKNHSVGIDSNAGPDAA